MYTKYFGLEEMPFSIAPDPRYLYMSKQHREALAHLLYGINSDGGFVLLTGDVGTGKTTVCRCFLEQIPENTPIAFIINPKLTVDELLATICDEFDIHYPQGNTSIKTFVDLINTYLLDMHAKGYKAVLIIDEAQNLSADVLEQLRLLTNMETNQHKLLQIVLLGQPELRDKLLQQEMLQLAQRITARYHLAPLSKKDVAAYIAHRLSVAGLGRHLQRQLFPASTISAVFHLSRGIPRLINVLCDRALLGIFAQGRNKVNKTTLTKAALEVLGKTKTQEQHMKTTMWILLSLLFIVFGIVLATTYYNQESQRGAINIISQESQQPGSLQWPENKQFYKSEEIAYQTLYKLWGITYHQDNGNACQQVQKYGLRCLVALGNLDSIRHLNRPAVLKLFDEHEHEFYVTLMSFGEQVATLAVGGEIRKVTFKEIESRWFGDYTLLWRTPPNYQGAIYPGSQGAAVKWLKEQLALVQGRTVQYKENMIYDDTLVKQVRKFQIAKGLIPDGIVGTKTLVHLNTALGKEIPTLTDMQEDM